MPELPDITVYVESLERRIVRQRLERVRLLSPFVLRSVEPPLTAVAGRRVAGVRRLGKRIVLALEEELFLVLHLMIAGRLRWLRRGDKPPARLYWLCSIFRRHAGIHRGWHQEARLAARRTGRECPRRVRPGGVEVLTPTCPRSARVLLRRTIRSSARSPTRACSAASAMPMRTNPASGPALADRANAEAYGRRSRAAPRCGVRRAGRMDDPPSRRGRSGFSDTGNCVPAGMAVHGRFGEPCPVCSAPVQRIVYAENETNYCARCQTGA